MSDLPTDPASAALKGPLAQRQTGEGSVLSSAGIAVPGEGSPKASSSPAARQGLAGWWCPPEPSSSGGARWCRAVHVRLEAQHRSRVQVCLETQPRSVIPASCPARSGPGDLICLKSLCKSYSCLKSQSQSCRVPRGGVSRLSPSNVRCSSEEQMVSAPGVGFPGSASPEPCRVPRAGLGASALGNPMDFTAPQTTTAPSLSPRGARTPSARVLPGSGAASQPGAAGSGEGSRALIPAIRGGLIGFFVGFFFSFSFWSVVLIQVV